MGRVESKVVEAQVDELFVANPRRFFAQAG